MIERYDVLSEHEMRALGTALAGVVKGGDFIELIGDVGAGKTTFVKGLARGLEASDEVQSPSFTISRVYDLKTGERLVHYDFYRLNDPGILRDELEEVAHDSTAIVVIEWADIVSDVLPAHRISLTIRPTGEDSREVLLSGLEKRLLR